MIKISVPPAPVDPITVEVIGNSLASIVEEMGEIIVRSSYSTNIKERRDCSAALFDLAGNTIAQAEHIPVHLGSLIGIIGHIIRRYPMESIAEGDLFIGNDAYTGGGTHLPDIVLASPIFHEGRLVAWTANLAHHSDFVDRHHEHIFQEGLRIPPVRLHRAGKLQEDVLDLILLNCQVPDERRKDLRAQIAANDLGIRRYQALSLKYGVHLIDAVCNELMNYSERRMRAGIALIKDGHYPFEAQLDGHDFEGIFDLKIVVEVRGEEIHFDFAGNPPQIRDSINVVMTALLATLYYAVKAIVDPTIPPNSGVYRPIHVSAPEGSIVNCISPAAVHNRTQVGQRIADMVFAALAPALPEKAMACCTGGGLLNFSGTNPRTGRFYVYNESIGGGAGGRSFADGYSGVQVHTTNTSNLPVEALEAEYPLQVECYELVDDSCGAGEWRGGQSLRRRIRVVEHDARIAVWGTCVTALPWGLEGGTPGCGARIEGSFDLDRLTPKQRIVYEGEWLGLVTAGGGGFGKPTARSRELVIKDLAERRISLNTAREIYGLTELEIARASETATQ